MAVPIVLRLTRERCEQLECLKKRLKLLKKDLEQANFTAKERALISFARKANTTPLRVPDEKFSALKQTGATDAEVIEALGVMELFTAFNKFLDVLQVEVDF